ncbi:hypothetical protein HEK131_37240 [Streptomyces seoulensis]|nr:hypothetical protein HEK131_37240 [Streptomyces seoulensis]
MLPLKPGTSRAVPRGAQSGGAAVNAAKVPRAVSRRTLRTLSGRAIERIWLMGVMVRKGLSQGWTPS